MKTYTRKPKGRTVMTKPAKRGAPKGRTVMDKPAKYRGPRRKRG